MGRSKTVAEANGTVSGKKSSVELTPQMYRDLLRVVELASQLATAVAGKPTVDRNSQLAIEIQDEIMKLTQRHKIKINK